MQKPKKSTKTIGKRYVVKVNEEAVFSSFSRSEALRYIGGIHLTEAIENVKLVRESVNEYVLKSFTPKVSTVLICDDLGPTID